jgi:hypothetical protein
MVMMFGAENDRASARPAGLADNAVVLSSESAKPRLEGNIDTHPSHSARRSNERAADRLVIDETRSQARGRGRRALIKPSRVLRQQDRFRILSGLHGWTAALKAESGPNRCRRFSPLEHLPPL